MRLRTFLFLAVCCFVFVQGALAQTSSTIILRDFLEPDSTDVAAAQLEGAKVFRIYKRGTYDDTVVRGGGAYYSFLSESHSYNHVPQIELQDNYLLVGFYGANYGFMTDLGKTALLGIDLKTPAIKFLTSHTPTDVEEDARVLYRKAQEGFVESETPYLQRLPAVLGNTYALRAVSFREADTLVTFRVHRIDTNGSMIIFWKKLKDFPTPVLKRNN